MIYLSRVTLTVLLIAFASSAQAQQRRPAAAPFERGFPQIQRTAIVTPAASNPAPEPSVKSLLVGVPLADLGLPNGFRLSNLGGRREVYVPVPQGVELNLSQLVLAYDDVSAHEARRSLEILVNDRSMTALALDGRSVTRTVRIPLVNAVARDGFLKLSFLYSGAATQDRCIDVRYVGDSLTVRPESEVEFELGIAGIPNIAATAALIPKDVAILLSNPAPPAADIAATLTLARSLKATGRQVTFYHGVDTLPALVERDDRRRWTRGLIVVGEFNQIADRLDVPGVTLARATGSTKVDGTFAAVRIGGVPVLLLNDPEFAGAGRLQQNPSLSVLRDTPTASVGQIALATRPTDRVSFDALGLAPTQADVFGRADLAVAIPSRTLPAGTRPSRLILDIMVAPDGAGEKAVVSAFVNERLLASTVAAIGEPTRLDFALPDGLVGSVANIRVMIQRRSSQGDCRFEPQGYPAEILGSSSIILSAAGSVAKNFSDLATLWTNGVEIILPSSASDRPLSVLASLADVLYALSSDSAPITVKYASAAAAPSPAASFIAVSNVPPDGADQHVRFDRGRVAVTDRAGKTQLDIGGLATGAVAQIVTSNGYPGLWIKSLSNDGSLPASPGVNLDRGDVAFLDKTGVTLELSSDQDTLLRVAYTDQESWFSRLDRFRSWIIGGIWMLITLALLSGLQRIYRRRNRLADE